MHTFVDRPLPFYSSWQFFSPTGAGIRIGRWRFKYHCTISFFVVLLRFIFYPLYGCCFFRFTNGFVSVFNLLPMPFKNTHTYAGTHTQARSTHKNSRTFLSVMDFTPAFFFIRFSFDAKSRTRGIMGVWAPAEGSGRKIRCKNAFVCSAVP